MFKLSSIPLEQLNLTEGLESSGAGALSTFEGRVRDHNEGQHVTALKYEAYEPLCQTEAKKILEEARQQFDIIQARCFHRVGRLSVGEMAVWVGVIAAHRDDAFKACRYLIDEIKARMPIWKKEFTTDGASQWVNGAQCARTHQTGHEAHPPARRAGGSQSKIPYTQDQYYARQMILKEVGTPGQERLRKAKILVVGAGGLGSSALLSLAGAGVGTIGICEHDILELSNLHRQHLYAHTDIGQPKIQCAAQRIKALNPFIDVIEHSVQLNADNAKAILAPYDYILDCTDNFPAKFLLNDACVLFQKILIQASIYQYEGQIRTYLPKQSACLRCLWPDIPAPGSVGSCAEAGVLGVVPGVLGHIQSMEALRLILNLTHRAADQTNMIHLLNFETRLIKEIKNPGCPVCGSAPAITQLFTENYCPKTDFCVNIHELPENRLSGYTFIDIREPDEIDREPADQIPCVRWPLSKQQKKPYPLDPAKQYIIFCAKGGRSLKLVRQLRQKGLNNIVSLNDGMTALKNHFQKK